jgi:quinol monooxygenase YgiN
MRLAQRKRVAISLIHSLIRATVEDLGCLGYLLLDKNARPNSISSFVLIILSIEVYSNALYYL